MVPIIRFNSDDHSRLSSISPVTKSMVIILAFVAYYLLADSHHHPTHPDQDDGIDRGGLSNPMTTNIIPSGIKTNLQGSYHPSNQQDHPHHDFHQSLVTDASHASELEAIRRASTAQDPKTSGPTNQYGITNESSPRGRVVGSSPPTHPPHRRDDDHRAQKNHKLVLDRPIRRLLSILLTTKNPVWSLGLSSLKLLIGLILRSLRSILLQSSKFSIHLVLWAWDEIIFPATFPIRILYWLTISKPLRISISIIQKLKPLIIFLISAILMGILIGRLGWTTQVYIGNRLFPLPQDKSKIEAEEVRRVVGSHPTERDHHRLKNLGSNLTNSPARTIQPVLDLASSGSSPRLKSEGKRKETKREDPPGANPINSSLSSSSSSSSSTSTPSQSDRAKDDWGSWISSSSSSSMIREAETELRSEIKAHRSKYTSAMESNEDLHHSTPRYRRSYLDRLTEAYSPPSSSSSPSNSTFKPDPTTTLDDHHPPNQNHQKLGLGAHDPSVVDSPHPLPPLISSNSPSSTRTNHHHKKKVTFKSD